MLSTLKDLFDSFAAPAARQTPAQQQHAAQLATAVLLVEVMRADPAIGTAERLAVVQALRSKFSLADDELDRNIFGRELPLNLERRSTNVAGQQKQSNCRTVKLLQTLDHAVDQLSVDRECAVEIERERLDREFIGIGRRTRL